MTMFYLIEISFSSLNTTFRDSENVIDNSESTGEERNISFFLKL